MVERDAILLPSNCAKGDYDAPSAFSEQRGCTSCPGSLVHSIHNGCVNVFDEMAGEGEMLETQRKLVEARFFQIGFKRGLFESRQEHVQKGFDLGFKEYAKDAFYKSFFTAIKTFACNGYDSTLLRIHADFL